MPFTIFLKALNLTESLFALILVYSAGLGARFFYIAKGFFDTIPMALDESAMIDGANKWQIFHKNYVAIVETNYCLYFFNRLHGPLDGFYFSQKVIMGDKVEKLHRCDWSLFR